MPAEPVFPPHDLEPRKGSPSPRLREAEFKKRFLNQFQDKAYGPLGRELNSIASAAWDAYLNSRKSPNTRKAGPEFSDPDYDLSVDWLNARDAIRAARVRHDNANGPLRILLINGSSRSEHTCPGEFSKSFRMVEIAQEIFAGRPEIDVKILDLSRLCSEYGRQIHPCKACFSTSAALCHWPCSCYPNYSLGQIHDWMNDIYPMWVEAHGIMIVTPVNWYHTSSPLKLMMDRLVCADGGNPDPTTTHGKHAKEAKELEMKGWNYPRHLADRLFAVIAHGDTEGAEDARRGVSEWLKSMDLIPAGTMAEVSRYIGYWEPYATSHEALDKDTAMQEEVRNAARTLLGAILAKRTGKKVTADLRQPREK
ncbi:NADPH-dependent FMN reductase [Rhizobium sullae]|uniref:NADPH-dependent FMN reductase n=1 Tax=Rhizobium sullae TaxID=50338 RepID=A0A2N0D7Z8_RHISU|nr:flavodoxin family protein [Rhizobium sullae]PKA42233.1 NADPH-dependent FMN reductase [Rhizobium sullae]